MMFSTRSESIRMGGVRAGTAYDDAPTILNNVAGTKFDVISGYAGTPRPSGDAEARSRRGLLGMGIDAGFESSHARRKRR